MNNETLWESILTEIKLNVSKANYNMWFKDTFIQKQEDGVVWIGVPSAFAKEWLTNKYRTYVLKMLRDLSPSTRSVEFVVVKDPTKKKDTQRVYLTSQQNTNELPLSQFYINKEDNLNPRYIFDSFVVGPFNELAYAAAQAVVKNPGGSYNPLFVYGNTGHGKTHLIQAVGNHIKKSFPEKKIFYITSEKFTIDYINSISEKKMNFFKERYRKYDVIIMDDIQFLSGKDKTQEELFHLFNTMYENNKQIVFSSDKHPNFIPNLEDRLKSRFSAGMIVDIPPPDVESRSAILKTKAEQQGFSIEKEIIDFLSSALSGNIRELEGVLNSLIIQSQVRGRGLTMNEVRDIVKNSSKPKKMVSPKDVIKIIADFYNIDEESIYKKTRRKEIIKPRQVTMYILREDFNISFPSIGEKMGGRDHTTVIHSCEKIKDELRENSALTQELQQIRSML